jgi:transcriptional regulator
VPTWNYSTIHANGRIDLIEDCDGIVECLKHLTHHTEKHWPSVWDFFIPDDLSGDVLSKSIVGFRIAVEQINFKKKLSQNRSEAERVGILNGLELRSDENSHLVLKDMMDLYSRKGEIK